MQPQVLLDIAVTRESYVVRALPLAAARSAAALLVRRLAPEDVVRVVACDDEVVTVAGSATVTEQGGLPRAIEAIDAGGTTNLSGG
jgi:Ca-activated chloride channel family protein